MKTFSTILWALAAGMTAAGTSFAAEPLFCTAPFAAVCGNSGEAASLRQARVSAAGASARKAALQAVASRFGYQPADDAGYDAFEKAHPDQSDAMLAEFMRVIRTEADLASRFNAQEELGYLSRSRAAVEASLQGSPMIRDLEQIELFDGGQVLLTRPSDDQLFQRAIFQCGRNGLADNAFQSPGTHDVILCPGLLIASRPETGDAYPYLAWTLAHESSHTIDSSIYPREHQELRACIRKEFPQFPAGKLDAYMEEISADAHAAEAMAVLLREFPDKQQAERFIESAAATLCGMGDDGNRHPSDHFRIEILLGRNPRVRQALGCSPLPHGTPGCVLEGGL